MGGKNTSGTYSHTGLARDATDGKWKLFDGLAEEGHVGNVVDFANTYLATLVANVEANTLSVVNGVSGNVNFDSGTLFVNSVGNSVGIGTTTPIRTLTIAGGVAIAEPGGAARGFHWGDSTTGNVPIIIGGDATSANTGLNFSTAPFGTAVAINRMKIDVNGNVGIGTTSPGQKLDVNGAIQLQSSNPVYFFNTNYFVRASTGLELQSGDFIRLLTNGANERVRVDANGNVGIGTTSPGSTLEVNGTARFITGVTKQTFYVRHIEGKNWDTYDTTASGLYLNYYSNQPVYIGSSTHLAIHAGNYNSYAPTLTGGNASGTWGISITGSAAQLGGVAASNYFRTDGTYPNADMNTPVEGYWHVINTATGLPESYYGHRWDYDHAQNGQWVAQFYSPTSGDPGLWFRQRRDFTWQTWRKFLDSSNYTSYAMPAGSSATNSVDLRAPIFYDSNNTGYYVDPATTARLNAIYCGDVHNDLGGWFRNYNATGIYNQSYGQHFYCDIANYWNMGGGGLNGQGIRFRDNYGSTVRGYLYYDHGPNLGFLSSGGSWRFRIVGDDYGLFEGSSCRAQLFYDSNDTTYYVDPNSGVGASRFWSITPNILYFAGVGGNSTISNQSYAIYQEGGAWTHPYPDLAIAYHTGIKIGAYYGYNGTRFYNNNDMATQIASVGDGDNNFRSYYNIIAYASDGRLKENIQPITNAIEKVKKITGMTFDWKPMVKDLGFEPNNIHEAGVIAQEIEAVLPEAVEIAPFDYDWKMPNKSKSGEKYLTVKYEKIVPLLIQAIKEQQEQIEELKNLIKEKLS
jgi:hypothetical protein